MSDVGAVLLADNTDKFDYIRLAEIAAEKIKQQLNIPVAIISTSTIESNIFDRCIVTEPQKLQNKRLVANTKVSWLNLNRTKVYDLSPWDRTLLIDADLFVNTDTLTNHLAANFNFAIARNMYNPTTGDEFVQKLGKTQIDQTWATLIIFNKSSLAKHIFEFAEYVLENYEYYHKLYNFNFFPLRNDYAFSIATHLLGGYGQTKFDIANYKLANCDFTTTIEQINHNNVLVSYMKNNKKYIQRIFNDVHIQDKTSLFERINNE